MALSLGRYLGQAHPRSTVGTRPGSPGIHIDGGDTSGQFGSIFFNGGLIQRYTFSSLRLCHPCPHRRGHPIFIPFPSPPLPLEASFYISSHSSQLGKAPLLFTMRREAHPFALTWNVYEVVRLCRRPEVSSVCVSFLLPSPTSLLAPCKLPFSCTLASNPTYVKSICGQLCYVFYVCGGPSKKPMGVVFLANRFCANVDLDSLTLITSNTVCYGSDGNLHWWVHIGLVLRGSHAESVL